MADEPRLKVVESSTAELDEDERQLRALRLDLPGSSHVPTGIVSLSVGKIPRREFFRTHPEHRVVLKLIDHACGLDIEYHAVAPAMIPELQSIGIEPADHALYQILTAEGASRLVPVRQADIDGS